MGCGASRQREETAAERVVFDMFPNDRARRAALRESEAVHVIFETFPNTKGNHWYFLQGMNDISVTSQARKPFADKKQTKVGTKQVCRMGHCCKKGLKPQSPNQDNFLVLQGGTDFGLYAVFDGHGPAGHDISNYIAKVTPKNLVHAQDFKSDPSEAIKQCFIATHTGIINQHVHKAFDSTLSGATATVAWLHKDLEGKKWMYIGHVGDSRCIVGGGSDWKQQKVVWSSQDHKCDLPAEKARIESKNGVVQQRREGEPHRVCMKGSEFPGLAMSRSLGDLWSSRIGVSHVPEVTAIEITSEHQVLVLCSDGVWEFLSNETVLAEIAKAPKEKLQSACDTIAQMAWQQWIEVEKKHVDDITVIAVAVGEFAKFDEN
jgi:serine/threonine protein phosphatase PrpC